MISSNPSLEILEQEMAFGEEFFGTKNDPEQVPITMESWRKLLLLSPDCLFYETDKENKLVSWVIIIPTTKELMEKFINKEISEKQLLDLTQPQKKYEALYLCSAITIPENRRKGIALEVLKAAISKMSPQKNLSLFAWPTTEEGLKLADKLSKEIKQEILIRK